MWQSRTKTDLMIEVWEKLDCESVGAAEIEAIQTVVKDVYGEQALDSPMRIARLLADEGAELRHSEVMGLYVSRAENRPYEAVFNTILNIDSFQSAMAGIRKLELLRRDYQKMGDRQGSRVVREHALMAKQNAIETAAREQVEPATRLRNAEIAQWFTIWLQTPDAFENWLTLRQRSSDYLAKFGTEADK